MTGYRETFYVIGINDTFNHFRSNLISQENLTTLTFVQVISKARDFEVSLKSESAITRQQLEESDCTRSHLVRIQHTKRHPVQSNPKPLTIPPNHKVPLPVSVVAAHHMQLIVIVLPAMTPVTAAAKGVSGNKSAKHPLPIQ